MNDFIVANGALFSVVLSAWMVCIALVYFLGSLVLKEWFRAAFGAFNLVWLSIGLLTFPVTTTAFKVTYFLFLKLSMIFYMVCSMLDRREHINYKLAKLRKRRAHD